MDLDSLDDDDAQALAQQIGPHLDPGSYGDRVVLSRRQAIGLGTGALGAGALLSLGVDPAVAQAAGSVGTSSEPVDVFGYDVNVASSLAMNGNDIENAGLVSTEQADVTGEAFISATRASSATSVTAGVFTNLVDDELEDANDEFNTSSQFSPSDTGYYDILGQGRIGGGVTEGDTLEYRVRNITDGNDEKRQRRDIQSDGEYGFFTTVELQSNDNYEVQVTNQDSSYNLASGESITWLVIRRSIVHS